MLLTKGRYCIIITVLFFCTVLGSCKSGDNKGGTKIDSSDVVSKDTISIVQVLSDTAAFDFQKRIELAYNADPKVALKFLLTGNARFEVDSSSNNSYADSIPDSLLKRKPFLVVTDIDTEKPLDSVFNLPKAMYLQLASPGCLIDIKEVGAMEHAVNYNSTKIIIVLAHSNSSIIGAACNNVQADNFAAITSALSKAINASSEFADRSSANKDFVNTVAQNQAIQSINYILKQSPKLKLLSDSGKVILKSAFYNSTSRSVTLLNQNSSAIKPVTK